MLEIKIKYDTEDKEGEMILSNDDLENYNFVSIYLDDKEYIISINDLYSAIKAFKDQQKSYK